MNEDNSRFDRWLEQWGEKGLIGLMLLILIITLSGAVIPFIR